MFGNRHALTFALLLGLILLPTGGIQAATPASPAALPDALPGALPAASPAAAVSPWQATFWNNTELEGPPVLCCVTVHSEFLDFDWGFGSPDPDVNRDGFSARWTRTVELPAGRYRFTATSDDGVRLFLDGEKILDGWWDHAARTFTVEQDVAAGEHTVTVEFYERDGVALLQVSWERILPPAATEVIWLAEYFDNPTLTGRPVLVRDEGPIDFNWGLGSPASGVIPPDGFSVRWSQVVDFPEGTYRFVATSDDGVRLFLDGEKILDGWWDHGLRTFTVDRRLSAGRHVLVLEFYERAGGAAVQFGWELAPKELQAEVSREAWRGEYFNNKLLSGAPVLVREDEAIDFDWGEGSPAPGVVNPDRFSVRWTREVYFQAGRYRFITETDDGVRLFVDDQLIIDQWRLMPPTRHSAEIRLEEGWHTIRMEYFENTVLAVAKLWWERAVRPTTGVGNLVTCAPPNPPYWAWVRIYRLEADGSWTPVVRRGVGAIDPTGRLKIDGLPVDLARYGDKGHPYWIELWIDGKVAKSVGNFQRGEPEFRIRPGVDNYTPWACPVIP